MEKSIKIYAVYTLYNKGESRELEYYFLNEEDAKNYVSQIRAINEMYAIEIEHINLNDFYVSLYNSTYFNGWVPLPEFPNIGVWNKNQLIKKLNKKWLTYTNDIYLYAGIILKKENVLEYNDSVYYKPENEEEINQIIETEATQSNVDFINKHKKDHDIFSTTEKAKNRINDIISKHCQKKEVTAESLYYSIVQKDTVSWKKYEEMLLETYKNMQKSNISKEIQKSLIKTIIEVGVESYCKTFEELEHFSSLMSNHIINSQRG